MLLNIYTEEDAFGTQVMNEIQSGMKTRQSFIQVTIQRIAPPNLITHNHATLDFIRHLQIFNKKNHSTSRHIAFIPCTCNNDILNIPFRFDLYSIHFLIHILTNINSTYTQDASSHILNQCVTCKYKNKNRHKSYDHVFDWLEMKMASLSHRDP